MMLFITKRRRKTAIKVGLVGLMLILGTLVVAPALAHSFYLERFRAEPQSVTVQDVNGTDRGVFHIDLTGHPDGTVSGPASLQVGETSYEFEFSEVEEIRLGQDGRPEGIALRGTGTMTVDEVKLQLVYAELNLLESDDTPPDPIFEITGDDVLDNCCDMEIYDAVVELTFGGE
jgi:hypothetical protein